jgi:hypothetical protein
MAASSRRARRRSKAAERFAAGTLLGTIGVGQPDLFVVGSRFNVPFGPIQTTPVRLVGKLAHGSPTHPARQEQEQGQGGKESSGFRPFSFTLPQQRGNSSRRTSDSPGDSILDTGPLHGVAALRPRADPW